VKNTFEVFRPINLDICIVKPKSVGRKTSRGQTKKRPKNSKNIPKNSNINPLPGVVNEKMTKK